MNKEIVFIPLTKGRTAFIDPEDFEKVGFEEWYLQTCPSGGPYATNKQFGLMHRFIMQAPAGVTKTSNPFNPWIARVLLDGKRHFLGCFASPEEAANAIQDAKGQTSIN